MSERDRILGEGDAARGGEEVERALHRQDARRDIVGLVCFRHGVGRIDHEEEAPLASCRDGELNRDVGRTARGHVGVGLTNQDAASRGIAGIQCDLDVGSGGSANVGDMRAQCLRLWEGTEQIRCERHIGGRDDEVRAFRRRPHGERPDQHVVRLVRFVQREARVRYCEHLMRAGFVARVPDCCDRHLCLCRQRRNHHVLADREAAGGRIAVIEPDDHVRQVRRSGICEQRRERDRLAVHWIWRRERQARGYQGDVRKLSDL